MPEEIRGRSDWAAARQEARAANLPLVLEIYLEGCPVCARLARETHTDMGVIKALNERFIPVRLEARKNLDLAQELNVTAAPTTLRFSPEGTETGRVVGFQSPQEYLTASA
jgi:thioredoxin-related protein